MNLCSRVQAQCFPSSHSTNEILGALYEHIIMDNCYNEGSGFFY